MSTPTDGTGNQWQEPGGPGPSSPPSGPPPSGPPAYGQPSSPSYGKYGQGQALPTAPAPTSPAEPPAWGQPAWGEPGYVPPGPQQRWVGGPTILLPASKLTNPVIVLSVLMGIGTCLVAALAPNQNQMFQDALNGLPATTTPGSAGYRASSALGILVEVAVWVLTALWLSRVRQNAVVLRPGGQRRSETWVWLGWIIPIVNLWFPKQLVDDALRATASATGDKPLRTGFWWAAWITMSALGVVQAGATFFPPNDSFHLTAALVDVIVTAIGLVLWIRIVRRLSADQDRLVASQPVATLPW